MDVLSITLKFVLTFLASMLFGLERQRSHKPIGFSTYIFVTVGSCALSIVATIIEPENPIPLLGSIITGIGFLGAGALIKTSDKIFGFTSAASIWIFAIFGVAVGVGQYFIALCMYISIWIIIMVDRHLETKSIGSYQKKIVITTNRIVNMKDIQESLSTCTHSKLIGIDLDKKQNKLIMTFLIEGHKEDINQIPKRLYEKEWFESFKVD
ncbi:MAG: MgtC/SapB family protein [Candidatus Woesearchaeota archaeon]|jgi:putative Mg2+ transporter-C (MgtC) family protein